MTDPSATSAPPERISGLLERLAAEAKGDRISLGEILSGLGERAFGIMMLILALPNAVGLGTIPGMSTVFGLPQIVLSLQMIAGMQQPWFPRWARDRSIEAAHFRLMVERSLPYLRKLDAVVRPRLAAFVSPLAERVIGFVCLVLAILVTLPIPFANQPPGVAMSILSLGVVERDGLFVLLGFGAALIAMIIAVAVAGAIGLGIFYAVIQIFG